MTDRQVADRHIDSNSCDDRSFTRKEWLMVMELRSPTTCPLQVEVQEAGGAVRSLSEGLRTSISDVRGLRWMSQPSGQAERAKSPFLHLFILLGPLRMDAARHVCEDRRLYSDPPGNHFTGSLGVLGPGTSPHKFTITDPHGTSPMSPCATL